MPVSIDYFISDGGRNLQLLWSGQKNERVVSRDFVRVVHTDGYGDE
jgi:hypothetical protein